MRNMSKEDIAKEIEKANKRLDDVDCKFVSQIEAEKIFKESVRKKPLPVGLTKAQHEYLESQDVGKAEYMRNLLVIDMEKNK